MTIKRRDFLKMGSFLTASVATLGIAGCNNSNNDDSSAEAPAQPASTDAKWQFPQSVASGDPKPDSIILWTRVVPTTVASVTASSTVDLSIRLRVTAVDKSATMGTTTAFLAGDTLVADVVVPSYAAFDNTVRHKITGLSAGTTYYYQFQAGAVTSKVGRFKTAPAASASPNLKFVFMTCQDWNSNHWAAFTDIATNHSDLDFFVHLGDYIYETDSFSSGTAETAHGQLTLPKGSELPDNSGKFAAYPEDYRYLYKSYRSDPRLQKVHEMFPVVAIWDDHEFSDDCWQDAETYDNANQLQPSRRRAANQTWYEYMPADADFNQNDGSFQNIKIYRDLKFGTVAHLVMTDERLYRADHLIPETANNPLTNQPVGRIGARYMVPEASLKYAELGKGPYGFGALTPNDPNQFISMLGQTQRNWWMTTMQSSTAAWKIWGNEVSLLRMGVNGSNAVSTLLGLSIQSYMAAPASLDVATASAAMAVQLAAGLTTDDAAKAVAAATAIKNNFNPADQGLAAVTAATTSLVGNGVDTTTATNAAKLGVGTYVQALQAAAGGTSAQMAAAISFVASNTPLKTFQQKFVLNADQWDGYRAERKGLMDFLHTNNIQNVVAITGDIHAFFAGQVYNDFPGEVTAVDASSGTAVETAASAGGTPVIVDLVTAGISSSSWFTYLGQAVGSLSAALAPLVLYTLKKAQTSLPVDVTLPVLDFTMGKPFSVAALTTMAKDAFKKALAFNGIPEAAFTTQSGISIDQVAGALASNTALQGLCSTLASLQNNPWIKHIDTDAQGYALVQLDANNLTCTFNRVNNLFVASGVGYAPGTVPADARPLIARQVTVSLTTNSTTLTVT